MKKITPVFLLPLLLRMGMAATLAEWNFEQAGNLQGWQPNAQMANLGITNGIWHCRTLGHDPILIYGGKLEFAATPFQQIEVRLKADRTGAATFFWSNTSQGRYGGFEQHKTTTFSVNGDGQWHTYRLLPFWQAEKKIVRLRFDLYEGGQFAVDYIRIVDLPASTTPVIPDFDFARGAEGWQAHDTVVLQTNTNSLQLACTGEVGFALSPPLNLAAQEHPVLSLRMATDRGKYGTIFYATEKDYALHRFMFPLQADGREHTYNLRLQDEKYWRGRIVALGLQPSEVAGATARLRWLKISTTPQGPPQPVVTSFAPTAALPRAGQPMTLVARLANTGGAAITNLRAAITLSAGVRLMTGGPQPFLMGVGEEQELSWQIETAQPTASVATLTLNADSLEPVTAQTTLKFSPHLNLEHTSYVPEPKPVRGPFEVGVYYFPGWNTPKSWEPLAHFAERKPVLGWYREGDPEVADWQTKWAVEHGITFFVYDWYWDRGKRILEHGLHDAYFKARYHHLLKFCLLWANHNPPQTSSREDCIAVTRYWIENYFRRPEHLQVNGKPLVIIFAPSRLTEDLGVDNVKPALEAMRAECRAAGLPGLHLVACVHSPEEAQRRAAEGYDAVTAYNWPHLDLPAGKMYDSYAALLPSYCRQWENFRTNAPIPLAPLPVSGGWDARPWHGANSILRYGRTPELFRQHLQDAKNFLQQPEARGNKMLLIEAWNEWGEGSYIEPHREFGFGYLDAIRAVFTDAPAAHDDATPADVGLGPYDVPQTNSISPAR